MAAQNAPAAKKSFIHSARRAQLVQGAIEVIAQAGLDEASMVRIARHSSVSRGVVAYHFVGRDDLVTAVVAEVYRLGEQEVKPAVVGASTPRDALLAFVGHSIDFYAAFPTHLAALREITVAARRSPDRSRATRPQHVRELSDVADLLRAGQRAGQFRDFDADVMTSLVRGVLDSAAQQVAQLSTAEPIATTDADRLAALRAETIAAVDAMTTT